MDPLEHLLHPDARAFWAEYRALEAKGLRRQALACLDRFNAAFQERPFDERRRWVEAMCTAYLGDDPVAVMRRSLRADGDIPIRHTLVRECILPVLLEGMANGDARSFRWAAQFAHHFYADNGMAALLGAEPFGPERYLQRALAIDPDDRTSAALLLQEYAKTLRFYVHHVPDVVLAEPEEFRAALMEFRELAERYDLAALWEHNDAEWAMYCERWAEFCAGTQEMTFAEYLERT